MKKRILSALMLLIMIVSAIMLVSCGKEDTEKCQVCGSDLVEFECENKHTKDLCTNKDCILNVDGESPLCGEKDCGKALIKKMKFKLDFDALGESAMILCKGMLGIFIVTGVIIAFILVLNTVVEKVNQIKENKENK